MRLFGKKKEETSSCCCGGDCTPETKLQINQDALHDRLSSNCVLIAKHVNSTLLSPEK